MSDPVVPARKPAARRPVGRSIHAVLDTPAAERAPEETAMLDQLAATVQELGRAATAPFEEPVRQIAEALTRPYASIVETYMKNRDISIADWQLNGGDEGVVMAPSGELEVLHEVAQGVDAVALHLLDVLAAQQTTAEAQKTAGDQLTHVGKLLEAGNRSNTRFARAAIAIAVVAVVVTAIGSALQVAIALGWRP